MWCYLPLTNHNLLRNHISLFNFSIHITHSSKKSAKQIGYYTWYTKTMLTNPRHFVLFQHSISVAKRCPCEHCP